MEINSTSSFKFESIYSFQNESFNPYSQNNSDIYNSIPNSTNTSNIFQEKKVNDFGQSTFFDSATTYWVQLVITGMFQTPTAMFGILGNVLSVRVLSKKKMRSSLSILLIALSICDLIVCLNSTFLGVYELMKLLSKFKIAEWYLHLVCVCKKYFFPIASAALTGSTYYTVAITFERFIAVCWPMHCRSIITRRKITILSILIVFFTLAFNIQNFYSYILTTATFSYESHRCETTKRYYNLTFFLSYSLVMYFIPIIIIILVNGRIIFRVHQQNKERKKMTPYQKKKLKLTNMLITLVSVYLICNILRLYNEFTKLIFNHVYAEFTSLSNWLVTFNSAVNYIIYCAFGKTFRQSFIHLFVKCGECKCPHCSTRSNPSEELREGSIYLPSLAIKSKKRLELRQFSKNLKRILPSRSQNYTVNCQ